jgi:hypothetical protein
METSKELPGETLFDLTLFVAATPASRLASPAQTEKVSKTLGTCGHGYENPLAFLDPVTQSWRMYKVTLPLEELPLLKKLPTSGMTANGVLYQPPAWERITEEIVLSLWPTPVASGGLDGGSHSRATMKKLEGTEYEVPSTGQMNPEWVEWLMGFPIGWTDLEDSETP